MRQLTDLVQHRVEANLDAIRATLLVDLPADRCARACRGAAKAAALLGISKRATGAQLLRVLYSV